MYRTALARRYRPRRFGELVGQEHVSSTLRAAVEGGRVAHAYLFCGPRGIGKTTAARILAMALNCENREGGEPCGECESCRRIWSGQASLDVVEIDAASHRGVDDARDLRERAMYAPSDQHRYKVYIVDEAHMLTRDAWNALLKILEEPPPRVIFAFATTEPQKIQQSAAPVLSRCQRFDFRRVSVRDLLGRLRVVLEQEGVEAEEEALLPIARRAEGGVRDALSLMDQVLSFAGDRVGMEDVRQMLGLVDEERYLQLLDILARGDRTAVFPFVRELLDEGYDLAEFVRGLGEALRTVLVLRIDPGGESVELLPESRERFQRAGEAFTEPDLVRLLSAVTEFETSGRFRRSAQQRLQLEVLLLWLASMDSAVELQELLRAAGGEVPEEGRRRARPPAPGGSSPGATAAEEETAGAVEPGTDPTDPDAAPPATGDPSAELLAAWREALAGAGKLSGEAVALRGARPQGLEGGVLRLAVPSGLTADLQRFLSHRQKSAELRDRLCARLGIAPGELAFRVEESGKPRRVTAESAREQRLDELMAMDPELRTAVETLDLELDE